MKKIMIQKITQNNWNFWTVNLIMREKKNFNQSSDFPVRRTGSYRHKKALLGPNRNAPHHPSYARTLSENSRQQAYSAAANMANIDN